MFVKSVGHESACKGHKSACRGSERARESATRGLETVRSLFGDYFTHVNENA